MADAWPAPPQPANDAGEARRVGVEIEFAGLTVTEAAQVARDELGGELHSVDPQRVKLEGSELGDFTVELDIRFAHHPADSDLGRLVRDKAAKAAAVVIPAEIVCPPIPWDRCHRLDDLSARLRKAGAEGTRAAQLYAFGLQLNVEVAGPDPARLRDTIRAFLLLRDWLRAEILVDNARTLLSFAAPFSEEYCAYVLDPDYDPDLTGLIEDYLAFNPTRDRELDCLPLFAHLDEPRVRHALPDEKIKKRPAWHYRLPNCEIDDPAWSPGLEWRRWLRIERLAADPHRLMAASARWFADAGFFSAGRRAEASVRLAQRLGEGLADG
jgi:hypothetical protein